MNRLLIIPLVSALLLIANYLTEGFVDFYIPKNLIFFVNICLGTFWFWRNEAKLAKSIQSLKPLRELTFMSKGLLIFSGLALFIRFVEPIVVILSNKYLYYGFFYQLYYKYFNASVNFVPELIFLLVAAICFIALAKSKKERENNSDISKEKIVPEIQDSKNSPLLKRVQNIFHREGLFYSITLALTISAFIILGVRHLGDFMSVDEPKWFETRVPQFQNSLIEEDWANTYTNDKPGVVTSILGGIINVFMDPLKQTSTSMADYLFFWRLPFVLAGAFLLIPIYGYLKRLFDKNVAIGTTVLIGLNPTILGMSQIVNPDATIWSTAFLSLITFLLYIKTNKQKYILISGIFFGLGLLSKYFLSIFYILYFIIIYLEYLTGHKDHKIAVGRFIDLGKLVLISMLLYTAFFPATWFDYRQIILGTLGTELIRTGFPILAGGIGLIIFELLILNGRFSQSIAKALNIRRVISLLIISLVVLITLFLGINSFTDYKFFDLESFIWVQFQRRDSDIVKAFLASSYTTIFVLTLPIIIGTLVTFIKIIKNKLSSIEDLAINSSLIIISVFMLGSAIGGYIATARYQVMLIPVYILIAVIGITKIKNVKPYLIMFFAISLFELINISPFYLDYDNILNNKRVVINDSWGFGGYEFAQQLNSLPDAENIVVWSDREGFNEFFNGKSYWRGLHNPYDYKGEIDYLILTKGGERIFRSAAEQQQSGANENLYSRIAIQTDLLKYYLEEPDYYFCIDKDMQNCIRAVKFDK